MRFPGSERMVRDLKDPHRIDRHDRVLAMWRAARLRPFTSGFAIW